VIIRPSLFVIQDLKQRAVLNDSPVDCRN